MIFTDKTINNEYLNIPLDALLFLEAYIIKIIIIFFFKFCVKKFLLTQNLK